VYPNISGLSHNEINNNKNKHSLRSNIKVQGGKTHYTDSQNSDTTAPSGRELYYLQFSLQAASPETFWIHLRMVQKPLFPRNTLLRNDLIKILVDRGQFGTHNE
jgi:hypothetical protein